MICGRSLLAETNLLPRLRIKNVFRCYDIRADKIQARRDSKVLRTVHEYYDKFGKSLFDKQWHSVRHALQHSSHETKVLPEIPDSETEAELTYEHLPPEQLERFYQNSIARLAEFSELTFEEDQSGDTAENDVDESTWSFPDESTRYGENYDEGIYFDKDLITDFKQKYFNPLQSVDAPSLTFVTSFIYRFGDFYRRLGSENPHSKRKSFLMTSSALKSEVNADISFLLAALLFEGDKSKSLLDLRSDTGDFLTAFAIVHEEVPDIVSNDCEKSLYLRQRSFRSILSDAVFSKIVFSDLDYFHSVANFSNMFSKVVVTVPSLQDRTCFSVSDSRNMFNKVNHKNRLKLIPYQRELLSLGIKCLQEDGSLLYLNPSISNPHNDDIIENLLRYSESNTRVQWMQPFADVLGQIVNVKVCKFGMLIFPTLKFNCGPLYVSFIKKMKY